MNDDMKVRLKEHLFSDKTEGDTPREEPQENLGVLHLSKYFSETEPGSRQREQMKFLWDYLAQESEYEGEPIFKLKQIENRIGTPRIGETRLSKLYQFARLDADVKQKMKERDELSR